MFKPRSNSDNCQSIQQYSHDGATNTNLLYILACLRVMIDDHALEHLADIRAVHAPSGIFSDLR